jgi:GT2 family glycosyltransferase
MGAALLMRKEAFQKVGLFDPQFFLYMEEVDLPERVKKAGWKIYYLPDAKMIHHAGGSSDQDWDRSQTHFFESLIRYYRKRVGTAELFLLRMSVAAAMLIRAPVLMLRGQVRKAVFYLSMSARIWTLE